MDPALSDPGNLIEEVIGTLIRGMILRINLVHYSSKFGNSQKQFTVTDGRCKHYTSKYRKMATETIHENNGYGIRAMRTSVRRTTASSQTTIGTPRITCSSPSTT